MIKPYIIIPLLLLSLFSICDAQEIKNDIHEDFILMDNIKSHNLAPLKDMIGGSRIVMLGEVDHNSGNIFEAKIEVMKFLHLQMGFDIVAFESGFYDLKKAADEIELGGNVKLSIAKSIFPIWTNTKEFLPFINYIEENRNELLITGFDCQFSGEYVFENLKDDLKKFINDDISIEVVDSWVDHVETMAEEYEFVDDSMQFKLFNNRTQEISNSLFANKDYFTDDQEEIDFLIQLLHNTQKMASDYYINKTGTKSKDEWKAEYSNVRDQLMAENLIFLTKKYPNKKIICWGATAHFSNQIWKLEHEELKGFKPMGSYLKKQLGEEQVYTLAFTALKDKTHVSSSIEQEFMTKKARFGILDLKSSIENTEFASYCIDLNESEVYGDWKEVVDGLFLLDTITKTTPYLLDLEYDFKHLEPQESLLKKKVDRNSLSANLQNVFVYQVIRGTMKDLIIESAKIEDIKTKQAIPFVNVGIRKTLIGTSTDLNGNFTIKIPNQYQSDSVSISCIGYKTELIAVKDLPHHKTIALTPANENIKEVTVQGEHITAELIMKRAIESIEQNYIQSAYSQLRLYRQRTWNPKDGKFYLHEELRSIYDDNGYKSVPMYPIHYDGFQVSKQGRIAAIDTISGQVDKFVNEQLPIIGAIGFADVVDMRHNNFLNKRNLSKYEFEIAKSISTESGEQYLITFLAKKPKHRSTAQLAPLDYNGTITVNADDYAILMVNSTLIQDKEKIWLAKKYPTYKTEKVWFEKEIVSYKKNGNHYYLDKIHHTSNWDLRSKYFTEVIGLEIKEENLPRPEKDKYLSRKTEEEYDPVDWKFIE